MTTDLEVLIEGGKASPGPPLGPALGPLGVNVMKVVNEVNKKTKAFEGMKVPVKIKIDPKTKDFEISVGTPPTSALILKELNLEKGSDNPREKKVGNLTIEQTKKIAKMKSDSLLGVNVKAKVKEVIGSCVSLGVTVEGKDPREIQKMIEQGKFDNQFKK